MRLDDIDRLRDELGFLSLSSPSTSVASYFHSASVVADAEYSLMPSLTARRTPSAVDELALVLEQIVEVYAIVDVVLLEPAFE